MVSNGAMSQMLVVRSTVIDAPASKVFPLVNDFREWINWSPWEGLDPELKRGYAGPLSGVGAFYEWSGNRKAGSGTMKITSATPTSEIAIDLTFTRPNKASNTIDFVFAEHAGKTTVTWRLVGETKGINTLFIKLFAVEKMVAKDFERGLGQLKTLVEAHKSQAE